MRGMETSLITVRSFAAGESQAVNAVDGGDDRIPGLASKLLINLS